MLVVALCGQRYPLHGLITDTDRCGEMFYLAVEVHARQRNQMIVVIMRGITTLIGGSSAIAIEAMKNVSSIVGRRAFRKTPDQNEKSPRILSSMFGDKAIERVIGRVQQIAA